MGLGPATIANMKNSITTRCYWFPNLSGGSGTQPGTATSCAGGGGRMVIIRFERERGKNILIPESLNN